MVAKLRPPNSGGAFSGQMRSSRLFRRALCADYVHVSVFVVRALTFGTQANHAARSARADAVVAAAGLSLAMVALYRDSRALVGAGLLLNTTGCAATLLFLARKKNHGRRAPWWWTMYLLIGGNTVSLAYLAAGAYARSTPPHLIADQGTTE
jgi:hypothetical protein